MNPTMREEAVSLEDNSINTVVDAFSRTVAIDPDGVAHRSLDGQIWTWREYHDMVYAIATGLNAVSVGHGDRVAILLDNRPEFYFVDMAALHLGAIPFSIYSTEPADRVELCLRSAAPRVVVTESKYLETIERATRSVEVEHVVVIDDEAAGTLTFSGLAARTDVDLVLRKIATIASSDTATLIYTSGTTGAPKAVPLTHGNVMASTRNFDKLLNLEPGAPTLSFLPMAHIAERACSHYLAAFRGLSVTSCGSDDDWMQALSVVQPHWLSAASRVWEKLRESVDGQIARLTSDSQQVITETFAEALALEGPVVAGWGKLPAEVARELDLIRKSVGLGALQIAVSGGAAIDPALVRYFGVLGILLLPIWGMTETGGTATANLPGKNLPETSGLPLDGIEIRITESGELLVRGEAVFSGYLGVPRSDEWEEDWFHTGDLGAIDAEGFLTITGRAKELIVSSSGKNMNPVKIERIVGDASPLFRQALVFGDNRPYNVAVISLDPNRLDELFQDLPGPRPSQQPTNSGSVEQRRELLLKQDVQDAVESALEMANSQLSRPEQIKRCFLVLDTWDEQSGFMTPTHKLRRPIIYEAYDEQITALYEAPRTLVVMV